ncbi:CAP domain-containing protein [Serpentinicella alkaliphila]|uniref:Putative YkwD family protein n=1 Tax=Serpentinicella alkaliphila TaxID=1734049 RepID=A0A4R2T3N6_9FIRM|nr:CAP domain-containing protein [Serpentinicella alkaliphila]QUH26697.1 hypothetical protein HZR23_13840 [Serpentinicella alkaliphila]TCP96615.1 putative YkwD family protein [Serpentinicella alkaliphila]
MLKVKLSRKVAISVLSTTLVLSTVTFPSASTVYRVVYNPNTNVVRTSSNYSITQILQRYNIRVAPVQQTSTPIQQPQAPATQPQAPVQQQPQQNVSNARHSLTANEVKLVELVNSARANAGLAPLAIDVDLSYVARVKSQDMHDNKYFSHTSPTYGSPFDMMKKFGIQYRSAAENIARTSSVESAHNGFMNSEGHRKNIMNPRFTHIGIGIYNGYYTQMFIQK